jgi:transposase-like protein
MKLINYRYSLDLASNSEYIESITLNDVLVEKKESGNYMEDWNTEQDESRYSCPKCNCECLSLERYQVVNGRAIQIVACHGCNFQWKDTWGLPLSYVPIRR